MPGEKSPNSCIYNPCKSCPVTPLDTKPKHDASNMIEAVLSDPANAGVMEADAAKLMRSAENTTEEFRSAYLAGTVVGALVLVNTSRCLR